MRLIDGDALKNSFFGNADGHVFFVSEIFSKIDKAPTVDPVPKGHWVISKDGTYPICSVCSARGGTQYNGLEPIPLCTNFCPMCGARMEVAQ